MLQTLLYTRNNYYHLQRANQLVYLYTCWCTCMITSSSLSQPLRAGSTAVAALFRGQKLYMGWLGDSQAVLVRRNKPTFLVEPHKPDREVRQPLRLSASLLVPPDYNGV